MVPPDFMRLEEAGDQRQVIPNQMVEELWSLKKLVYQAAMDSGY